MRGPFKWVWEPGFSLEVTHIGGDTRVAMEVGFGLRPKGSQLMFMVKTTAPKEWVALSGDEVRLLDDILEFFESHKVYFVSSRRFRRNSVGLVLCSDTDYDPLMNALSEYSSLTLADEVEAERLLDKEAASMTSQANILLKVITSFVDQADIISKVGDDPGPYPPEINEADESETVVQREQIDLAVQDIVELRRDLVAELDSHT